MIHSVRVAFGRFAAVVLFVWVIQFGLFYFVCMFAEMGASMHPIADPRNGYTYFVKGCTRRGCSEGYVKPSIGRTYDKFFPWEMWSLLLPLGLGLTGRIMWALDAENL
jgi:hypothetical protein